jgi:hypothetical protein
MDWLLPFFVIADAARSQRAAIVEQLLPISLPVPNSVRLTMAAMNAEQQLRQHSLTERGMLEDAIRAARFTKPSDLDPHPALKQAFDRLPPDVQDSLFKRSPGPEAEDTASSPRESTKTPRSPKKES